MKKILILCILWISFLAWNNSVLANDCNFQNWDDTKVTDMINNCMKDTSVVAVKGDATLEAGFKEKIQGFTNNIALFLWLVSIGSIIYGWLMMTLSAWEDEKIKKAKDIVKWSLIWLLWVILATTIVTLVINIIYGIPASWSNPPS